VSIATMFAARGETAFREVEARALPSFLAASTASVLSVGGGAVIDVRNRQALAGQDVVWLRASPETLAGRVGDGSGRPLLGGEDVPVALARLSGQREPLYTEVADVVVDVDELTVDE